MPSARKRKSNGPLAPDSGSKKKARPAAVSQWSAVHVAEYLRACKPGSDRVADAIEHEEITGRVATKLTEKDLKSMTTSVGECKAVYTALQDLKHPLMPAFIQLDTDESNTISASELAHVLTRVRKRCVTAAESSALIKTADTDESGDIDFQEFKHILESDSEDWAAAAEAVGAPKALLNGAVAFRDQMDETLNRTHSAMRSGSGLVHGNHKLKGMMFPSVAMRIVVINFLGLIPVFLLYLFTLGLALIFELFVLWPRGQSLQHWIFGTQYRKFNTGQPLGFLDMVLMVLLGFAISAILGLMSFGVGPGLFWLVELITACNDPHGRTLTDKMIGNVLVYRPTSVSANGRYLYKEIN